MGEHFLVPIMLILVLGMAAQWVAWRFQVPSILFLLLFGFLAGPVLHWLNPDQVFGELLTPLISVSIAIILFEGGLTLKLSELKHVGKEVWNLVSIGSLVTWVTSFLAAHYLMGLNWSISLLLGAILIVTGPTVIGPLLYHIRPRGNVSALLKWEGIVIDPIGALFSLLLFEALAASTAKQAGLLVAFGVLKTIFFGTLFGVIAAKLLLLLMRRFWLPDYIQEEFTLMMVVLTFVISNLFQHESGLFAVTLMGVVFENQTTVTINHIVRFKENIRLLVISALFIILAARLDLAAFQLLDWKSLGFLLILLFISRPLGVFLSTIYGKLNWKEKVFAAWMAPRGIVAASVASIFALRLRETQMPQAGMLVPVTFMVIVGTVLVYGLTAPPLAWRLKLAEKEPQGILMIGAQQWIRSLAKLLVTEQVPVLLIDSNRNNILEAKMEGLRAYWGNALTEEIENEIDLFGLGKLFAVTPNEDANSLAVLHFRELFGSKQVFQFSPKQETANGLIGSSAKQFHGRYLFSQAVSYQDMMRRLNQKWEWKKTKITDMFTIEMFMQQYKNQVLPLLLISPDSRVSVFSRDYQPTPQPGDILVALAADVSSSVDIQTS